MPKVADVSGMGNGNIITSWLLRGFLVTYLPNLLIPYLKVEEVLGAKSTIHLHLLRR